MKAILVFEMPRCCGECELMDDDCAGEYCNAHGDDYIDIPDTMGGKPDWCPLRELPEPMEVCGTYPQPEKPVPSYRFGWNACLKAITGN